MRTSLSHRSIPTNSLIRETSTIVEMCEAHGEHGHQTLPAGEDLRVIAVLSEQVDSPFDGVRAVIGERGSLHGTSCERAASRSSAFSAAGCICAFRFLRPSRKPIAAPAASAARAGAARLAIGTA